MKLGSIDPTVEVAEFTESATEARAQPVLSRSKRAAAAASCSRSKYCFRGLDGDSVSIPPLPVTMLSIAEPAALVSNEDDDNDW